MKRFGLVALVAVAACGGSFKVRNYPTPISLYEAGMREFERGKWDNAITALDQVTILLPPRDTLLPRALHQLALSYERKKAYLLAAATYKRQFEEFPDDSLAVAALLGMARSEELSWRGPEFDAQPAIRALDAYALLARVFASSPLAADAMAGEARMREGLARKDLLTGVAYIKRRLWDSALIYLRDASQLYPGTTAAREAMLHMVTVYRQLKYMDDIEDVCRALRAAYASDPQVVRACAGIQADSTG